MVFRLEEHSLVGSYQRFERIKYMNIQDRNEDDESLFFRCVTYPPFPVAARPEAKVCFRLIAGSNFAGGVVVFPLCVFCVVFVEASATSRGRSLVQASPKVSA